MLRQIKYTVPGASPTNESVKVMGRMIYQF